MADIDNRKSATVTVLGMGVPAIMDTLNKISTEEMKERVRKIPKKPLAGCGCDRQCCIHWHCPRCGAPLTRTEADGLWCDSNCFDSELELWEALQKRGY